MAGIDDFTPTQYGKSGGGELINGIEDGPTMTDGGEGIDGPIMDGGGSHDLVASGEITLSFGWEYDPTSD